MSAHRPRLALPFTVLTAPNTVRLVAGEDFRYTLTETDLDQWLPAWLDLLDSRITLEEALGRLPDSRRKSAQLLVDRMYGERILIDGSAADVHTPTRYRLSVEGSAGWADDWQPSVDGERVLLVLCQDRLDYDEALRFNRAMLKMHAPWMWASTGPMGRAYVSPLFLPDAGPCLGCLLNHFRRLSPAAELYDALAEHARAGRPIAPVPFPPAGIAIVQQLLLWKAGLAADATSAALYRLHVLEVATIEITTHRVFVDPECSECGRRN